MKEKNIKNKKGFTLIEIIVYLGILAMIVTAFISFSLAIANVKNKIYVIQAVNSNARNALELISQKIKSANDVSLPVVGTSDSILALDMPVGQSDVVFSLVDGVLYMGTDLNAPVAVTADEIQISELVFSNLARKKNRDSIQVFIRTNYRYADSREFEYENTFQTTITTRK